MADTPEIAVDLSADDQAAPADVAVNHGGIAWLTVAHAADDFYQGAVPALLPFLVAQRHYSYAAVAGLMLAATLLSSVAQPAFGWWTDKRPRRWMIGVGMLTAASGVALAGLFSSYAITWLVIAVSGLGIAAFHPEAARAARQAAGNSNGAMSIFALGGNIGFALGSLIATSILLVAGVRGTALLIAPGLVVALLLFKQLSHVLDGPVGNRRAYVLPTGVDDWPAFLTLTSVVIVRSIVFFGLTSFIALYFIDELGSGPVEGGAALTVFLAAGAIGTLIGGWLADRAGRIFTIRLGFILAIPAMSGLMLSPDYRLAMVFAGLSGIALFMPFSVFVVLGQDYLPNRIGTASGVTVGLAVSVGGLFNPILGVLADATSLRSTLSMLIALPAIALLLTWRMREAGSRRNRKDAARSALGSPPDSTG